MSDVKIVKAFCKKTKQYFSLEVRKFGSAWKVTNVTHLSDDEAKLVSSQVTQSEFFTNDNLLACTQCKTRKVGSCSCHYSVFKCKKGMPYKFNCVYCSQLQIDNSVPSAASLGSLVGKKITLAQGQEVEIRGEDNKPLKNMLVEMDWDPARGYNEMDVDSSVVMLSGKTPRETVYFGNLTDEARSVIHHGDNLTGENEGQEADETISISLDKVPSSYDRLVFVVNVYDSDDREQTLRSIKNFSIRICDDGSPRKRLIEYNVTANTAFNHDAIVLGVATRCEGGWKFKAVGKTLKVNSIHDLTYQCVYYI